MRVAVAQAMTATLGSPTGKGYDAHFSIQMFCIRHRTDLWKRLKQVVKEMFDSGQQRAKPNSGTLPVQRPRKTAINVTE